MGFGIIVRFLAHADRFREVLDHFRGGSILKKTKRCGINVRLRMPLVVYNPENISFGDNVDIGEFVILRGGGGLSIGSRVLIAAGACIVTSGHPILPPRWNCNVSEPIQIGDDVWIGANEAILRFHSLFRNSLVQTMGDQFITPSGFGLRRRWRALFAFLMP